MRFNWNTPIVTGIHNPDRIYAGSQFVHVSDDMGASWKIISPDLTTNDKLKMNQENSGGLSKDNSGAENHCTIICIAPSAVQKGLIYIGTDDGKVQMTSNGGATWTDLTANITGLPKGAWIPQIRTSAYNANEVFVVVNNYRQGDFAPYIFRSSDAGKTWTNMVDEKKVTGYALTVLQDPTEPNLIFVGTEQGMYISLDNGVQFQQWKNGYPAVSTYDFAIQDREADLAIATFGRSLWVLDDIRPLRKLAKAQTAKFFMSVPPTAINLSIKNSPYEWSTWGMWDAPNKPTGMAISIYSTDTVKKAKVQIKDAMDNVIRNLNVKLDSTGLNRSYWGFEQKGKRGAGAPKSGGGGFGRRMAEATADANPAEEREFTGRDVLPGKYKIVVTNHIRIQSRNKSLIFQPEFGIGQSTINCS